MSVLRVCALSVAAGLVAVAPVAAQEFGVYLRCSGHVEAKGKSHAGHLDLALRRNSQLAMVQRSDALPMGVRMRLEITPQFYTMVLDAAVRDTLVYYDWLRGQLVAWNPDLGKLHAVRIAVDRQSAALEGDMRDGEGALLGRLRMQCEPSDNDAEDPKF